MEKKKLTLEEKAAVREKMNHPEREVRCPRCGNLIDYIDGGNWSSFVCRTKGCIESSVRGL